MIYVDKSTFAGQDITVNRAEVLVAANANVNFLNDADFDKSSLLHRKVTLAMFMLAIVRYWLWMAVI